ncbi:hypothetical protein [Bordetella bronchiseptica]|nr:hypothetical protein [Bordetella bronchiseptica]
MILLVPTALLAGCAGSVNYSPPALRAPLPNTITIDQPIDTVWTQAVPRLGKQFFVINNLDKSSGLINISYSGNPESYIDCGRIRSHVQNLRGTRDYDFPAASASQTYEVMQNGQYGQVHRQMDLDGRVNLIFESIGKNATRVSANTKYVATKTVTSPTHAGMLKDSISFTSGNGATFRGAFPTECRATGALEQQILDAVAGRPKQGI